MNNKDDERLRKTTIAFLKDFADKGYENAVECIDWLKKQGKQINLPQFTFDDILALQCCMETVKKVQDDKELYKKLNDLHSRVYYAYHLEKQGEQKSIIEMQSLEESLGISSEECNDIIDECLYSELKSVNKVEPKFKQGEWIVWRAKYYKVNYNGCGYELFDQNGLSTSWDYITIEDEAHLWTIKDAKDGNILTESKGDVIFIFRGIGNTEWDDVIDYHCYYDCYRKCLIVQEDVEYWGNTKNTQLKPATKEQRELLFAKMKEAGYEWDAKEKELVMIEDEPENYKQQVMDKTTDLVKDHVSHKPTWSNEDERIYIGLINLIYSTPYCDSRKEFSDWLKSLKDRFQHQPK